MNVIMIIMGMMIWMIMMIVHRHGDDNEREHDDVGDSKHMMMMNTMTMMSTLIMNTVMLRMIM